MDKSINLTHTISMESNLDRELRSSNTLVNEISEIAKCITCERSHHLGTLDELLQRFTDKSIIDLEPLDKFISRFTELITQLDYFVSGTITIRLLDINTLSRIRDYLIKIDDILTRLETLHISLKTNISLSTNSIENINYNLSLVSDYFTVIIDGFLYQQNQSDISSNLDILSISDQLQSNVNTFSVHLSSMNNAIDMLMGNIPTTTNNNPKDNNTFSCSDDYSISDYYLQSGEQIPYCSMEYSIEDYYETDNLDNRRLSYT